MCDASVANGRLQKPSWILPASVKHVLTKKHNGPTGAGKQTVGSNPTRPPNEILPSNMALQGRNNHRANACPEKDRGPHLHRSSARIRRRRLHGICWRLGRVPRPSAPNKCVHLSTWRQNPRRHCGGTVPDVEKRILPAIKSTHHYGAVRSHLSDTPDGKWVQNPPAPLT